MNHVFVIGFMGAGKSTVGPLLARELGLPFVDADAEIERREGRSVSDVFVADGEAAFRDLEREEIARLAAGPAAVVACGGGAVTVAENREAMRCAGTVVLLDVTAQEAVARVASAGTRPLLRDEAGTRAERLLSERGPLYDAAADVVVDTVGRTPAEVASEAAALVEARRGVREGIQEGSR